MPALTLGNECGVAGEVFAYPETGTDALEPAVPDPMDIVSVGVRRGEYLGPVPGCRAGIEFDVATAAARLVPADANVQVFLDFDADGAFDKVAFSFYGADHMNAPHGTWYSALAPLRTAPDGAPIMEPDFQRIEAGPWPMAVAVDATIARLPVCANQLPGGGERPFAFAVRTVDGGNDYRGLPGFGGYDEAPNGTPAGLRFRYDPEAAGCLRAGTEAVSNDLDQTLAIPPSAARRATALAAPGCERVPDGTVVMTPLTNRPGERPLWRLGSPASTAVLLPRVLGGGVPAVMSGR
jgi:hypothetical protein